MPAPHYSVFYRSDALPAAQPTASKHWRQSHSTVYFQKHFLANLDVPRLPQICRCHCSIALTLINVHNHLFSRQITAASGWFQTASESEDDQSSDFHTTSSHKYTLHTLLSTPLASVIHRALVKSNSAVQKANIQAVQMWRLNYRPLSPTICKILYSCQYTNTPEINHHFLK